MLSVLVWAIILLAWAILAVALLVVVHIGERREQTD